MFVGAPGQRKQEIYYVISYRERSDSGCSVGVTKACGGTSITPSLGQSLFQLLSEPLIGPDGLLQTLTETPHLPQVLLYQIYP